MTPTHEHAAEAVLSKITYGSAGGAVIFGLAANEVAAFGGLLVAVLALIIKTMMDWHFRTAHLRLMRKAALDGNLHVDAE